MICKKCRGEIPNGSAYCNWCGAPQGNAPPKKPTKKPVRHRSGGTGTIRFQKGRNLPYAAYLPPAMGRKYLGSFATAQEASDALLAAIATRPRTPRIEWTVREFWEAYQRSDKWAKLSVKYQKSLRSAWAYITPLADRKMRDLKATDWQLCVDASRDAGKSISNARLIKDLISALCREAQKDDVISKNYAALLDLDGKGKKQRDIFTREEIALLRAHDDDVRAKFTLMLIYTGTRIGELTSILAADVRDTYMIGGNKTEAGRGRIIPILPEIRPYVDYFLRTGNGSPFLIHRDGAKVTENYGREFWFYPLLLDLGILDQIDFTEGHHPRITPHFARHTLATLADEAHVAKNAIARIVGHTDFETTDRHYVDMQAAHLYAEAIKISEMLAGEAAVEG